MAESHCGGDACHPDVLVGRNSAPHAKKSPSSRCSTALWSMSCTTFALVFGARGQFFQWRSASPEVRHFIFNDIGLPFVRLIKQMEFFIGCSSGKPHPQESTTYPFFKRVLQHDTALDRLVFSQQQLIQVCNSSSRFCLVMQESAGKVLCSLDRVLWATAPRLQSAMKDGMGGVRL